jgi:hypothetical protein
MASIIPTAAALRGGRIVERCCLGDADPESLGDIGESGETRRRITGRFIPLHLLFGDPQLVSKSTLCPTTSTARFDQQVGNTAQIGCFERALLTGPQPVIVADLQPEILSLSERGVDLQLLIRVRLPAAWRSPSSAAAASNRASQVFVFRYCTSFVIMCSPRKD